MPAGDCRRVEYLLADYARLCDRVQPADGLADPAQLGRVFRGQVRGFGDGGGSGGVVSAAQPAVCTPLAARGRVSVPDALGGRRGGEQLSEVKV